MKALKALIAIIIILVICIGAPYLYISIPKTVDTVYSDADYNSLVKKSGIRQEPANGEKGKVGIEQILSGDFKESGKIKLKDVTVTAPEIAAFVNKAVESDIIDNFNIAFHDGYIAVSFNIGDNVAALADTFPEAKPYKKYIKLAAGKPVYWELTLEKASEKSFTSTTKAIYIGQLSLPEDKLEQGLGALGSATNDFLRGVENFKVDKISVSESGLNFSGTLPKAMNLE